MGRFELALEDCLERSARGESLAECLARYPQYAEELQPLLNAAQILEGGVGVHPSGDFVLRNRARLAVHMEAHPQSHSSRAALPQFLRLKRSWQAAVALSVLILAFFITGTALAQSALPGQPILYNWKLTSESVWQRLTPNPVATNLALAERRTHEALAVTGANRQVALKGYQEILTRLDKERKADPSISGEINSRLNDQRNDLIRSGISVPELDKFLSSGGQGFNSPSSTPVPPGLTLPEPGKPDGQTVQTPEPRKTAGRGEPFSLDSTLVPGP